jgi:hypothetical protein
VWCNFSYPHVLYKYVCYTVLECEETYPLLWETLITKKMKKTKIFYGNQYIESFNCDGNRVSKKQIMKYRVKRTAIRTLLACIAFMLIYVIGYVTFLLGAINSPRIVEAEVIVEVEKPKEIPPVMKRIAKCESNNSHIDPKTGMVYMLANTNKTVDVGKYMINTVWHKKANELGYDVTNEEDNEKMAMWIYENFGTSPWVFSSQCWNR